MAYGERLSGWGVIRAYCSIFLLCLIFLILLWTSIDVSGKSVVGSFLIYASIPLFLLFCLSLINLFYESGWPLKLSKALLLAMLAGTVVINTIAMIFPDMVMSNAGTGILIIPLHLFGLLTAFFVGYHTHRFDKDRYSAKMKFMLTFLWILVWVGSIPGYLITILISAIAMGGWVS